MAEKKNKFHLLRYAEIFDDAIVQVTAHAPKKFRNNIVHDLQKTSENIVKNIFWGNEYRQSDIQECLKYTKQAANNIHWMTRRLERARRMECIDILQLADLKVQMVEHILFMYQLLIIILMIMPNRISIIVTGLFILKDMQF